MIRIPIDPEFQARLAQAGGLVEFCDQTGQTLGYFQPVPPLGGLKEMSPFSDEEIERRRRQRTGRPLKDILRDLENS